MHNDIVKFFSLAGSPGLHNLMGPVVPFVSISSPVARGMAPSTGRLWSFFSSHANV